MKVVVLVESDYAGRGSKVNVQLPVAIPGSPGILRAAWPETASGIFRAAAKLCRHLAWGYPSLMPL